MKQIIFSENAPAPIGPYSQAVLAGNTLYVSGQIAIELSTAGDLKAEARKIMENIGNILSEANMDFQRDEFADEDILQSMDGASHVSGPAKHLSPPRRRCPVHQSIDEILD